MSARTTYREQPTPICEITLLQGEFFVSANPDLDAKYIVASLRDVATKINRLIKQYEEA